MKAKLVENPPVTGDWIYELKFDGIRLIGIKDRDKVSLLSRNQNDLSARFPEIVDAVKNLSADECVIDGEVVALDEQGRSSFQLLQAREMEGRKSPVYFYAFDLLQLDGKSLISLPLEARKNVLEKLCAGAGNPRIRYSGAIGGDAKQLLKEVQCRGLEGIIGKLLDSVYEPGRRSGTWVKLKCVNEQEFVIGGYTPPQGARKHFGAVLVGYYKDRDSRIRRQGRHRIYNEIISRIAQEIPCRGTCRLSVCRSAVKTKRPMGVGHHAFDDEKDTLDQPEVCDRDQICRVDARRKIARTGFHGVARR